MIRAVLALLAMLSLWPQSAQADELRPASLELVQLDDARWQLGWKQPITRADEKLAVPVPPANCKVAGDVQQRRQQDALLGRLVLECEGTLAGQSISAADLVVSGDALLRIVPRSSAVQTYVLTGRQPAATLVQEAEITQVWRSYFIIGMEHILAGWDHLLFVIALVLIVANKAGRVWAVVKAATAFTLAHSITLALVTLGYAGLPQAPVEALIALSIVFLAVELARGGGDGDEALEETWTRRWPWLVAFVFGLLHGFGFAGALREIGLPQGEIPAALISFNLGVEAGQLLVIAAVLAIRAIITRLRAQWTGPAVKFAAYGTGIIGSYWLIDRVSG
jgi:hydrogenase/urease accessory protein HupE